MKCFQGIVIVFFLISMTLVCCGLKKEQSSGYFPDANWQVSTPEEQGIDSDQLAKVFDFVKENDVNIHSLILVRNGYLVLEAYFYPNSKGVVHDVASVTKSITSILVGIAVDGGFIKNVQQTVLDFFPDRKIADLDDRKKRLTIEHLLTMQTGLCRNFEDGERQLDAMRETNDWVQFMLDQPMLTEPGTEFAYCTGGTQLLSAIITQATGMNELDFARKYLFEPLGIHEVIWPTDPQGNNTGGFDLHMHSLDMAKIGHLLLNNGIWNGRQILFKKWIEQSTKVQVTLDDGERYGYLFWSPNENPDLIEGRGRGGQRLVFSWQRDIILVFTGSGFDPGEIGAILLPALRSNKPLPENPEGIKL
ncbi:MAG TPA: serine hydrolase, partial [bacterium]